MYKDRAKPFQDWDLAGLLAQYSGLRVQPQMNGTLILAGKFQFNACYKGKAISDAYAIQIEVPDHFPTDLPRVKEVGGRIPPEFHHYPDGTLCLGSPIRLALDLGREANLPRFVERFVLPYLYGFSHREQFGSLPFDELKHGHEGIVQDLERMLQATGERTCLDLLRLAGCERRKANRQLCPCGSGRRVGKCHNRILNRLRRQMGRLACRDWHDFIREHRLREKQQAIALRRRRSSMAEN
jgi:hypothetical protein